jgi:magnesium chelatase subunit H
MQYWLGGSDDNVEQMIRFLVGRYAPDPEWRKAEAPAPIDYPDVGFITPICRAPDRHRAKDLPGRRNRSPRSAC